MWFWGFAMLSLLSLWFGAEILVLRFAGDTVLRWLWELIAGLSLSRIAWAGGIAVLLKRKPCCSYETVGR